MIWRKPSRKQKYIPKGFEVNESHPFSIRIFVASGDPDGLRIIERSNWNGRAMVFPRPLLPEIKKREEFGRTGVLFISF